MLHGYGEDGTRLMRSTRDTPWLFARDDLLLSRRYVERHAQQRSCLARRRPGSRVRWRLSAALERSGYRGYSRCF